MHWYEPATVLFVSGTLKQSKHVSAATASALVEFEVEFEVPVTKDCVKLLEQHSTLRILSVATKVHIMDPISESCDGQCPKFLPPHTGEVVDDAVHFENELRPVSTVTHTDPLAQSLSEVHLPCNTDDALAQGDTKRNKVQHNTCTTRISSQL